MLGKAAFLGSSGNSILTEGKREDGLAPSAWSSLFHGNMAHSRSSWVTAAKHGQEDRDLPSPARLKPLGT